jgi:hypothetical protein
MNINMRSFQFYISVIFAVLGLASFAGDMHTQNALDFCDGSGSISTVATFEQRENGGLVLVVEYTNRSRKSVYLECHDGQTFPAKVIFQSDLPASSEPKDWTLEEGATPKDGKLEFGFPVGAIKTDKLGSGDSVKRIYGIERKYVRIADLHPKTNIYMYWMVSTRVFASDPAVARANALIRARIGGFFVYKKETKPGREAGKEE